MTQTTYRKISPKLSLGLDIAVTFDAAAYEQAQHDTFGSIGSSYPRGGCAKTSYNDTRFVLAFNFDDQCTADEVIGLIVHEAVHVWQQYCHTVGEVTPSSEFQAYGIQQITQDIFCAYITHQDEITQNAAP